MPEEQDPNLDESYIPKIDANSKRSKILTFVFLLIGTAVLLFYVIHSLFVLSSLFEPNKSANQNNSTSTTPTSSILNTSSPIQSNANNSGQFKTYKSNQLGISFNYMSSFNDGSNETVLNKVVGNKVYLYLSNQSLQDANYILVLNKEPKDTFEGALIKLLAANGESLSDCNVTLNNTFSQYNINHYEGAIISSKSGNKCKSIYSPVVGGGYFMLNPNNPQKFIFVYLGSTSIPADNNSTNTGTTWDNTITIL